MGEKLKSMKLLIFLLLFLIAHQGFGQTGAQMEVYSKYKEATNASLYNGVAYTRYLPEGIYGGMHPFFIASGFKPGTLVYNGRSYNEVMLKYDILTDEVVILYLDTESEVLLKKSEVEGFSIGNYNFINIPKAKNIPAGYYEILKNGKTKVLCRYKKTYKPAVQDGNSLVNMIEENPPQYYIENNNEFHPVRNEKSLYKIFPDKKKELKNFIQTNALIIQNSPISALPLIAVFIDK